MHLRLDPRRSAVPTARHWTRDLAREHGLPRTVVAVVELLTSELVSNAVVHGSGDHVDVRVSATRRHFTVRVTDASDHLPVRRTTGPEVPGGQGMRLVDRLADRWGTEVHAAGGKTVWFTVLVGAGGPTP